jgi:hypothetical protein
MSIDSGIHFLPQEKEWSCTVACVRMLLAYWGIRIEQEADLYDCCRSTVTGTYLDHAVAGVSPIQSFRTISPQQGGQGWGKILSQLIYRPDSSLPVFGACK